MKRLVPLLAAVTCLVAVAPAWADTAPSPAPTPSANPSPSPSPSSSPTPSPTASHRPKPPTRATFHDPVCDTLYVDWFYADADSDCSAADIRSVRVAYGPKRLTVTYRFAAMTDFGDAHIETFDVSFDSADRNRKPDISFDYHRKMWAVVRHGKSGRAACRLHGKIYNHRRDGRIVAWAPLGCIREAEGRALPGKIRVKAGVEADRNECAPGNCIDSWYDDLNYPKWREGHARWTSYVRRDR